MCLAFQVSRSPSKMLKRKTSSMNVKANPGEKKSRFKNRVPSMGPGAYGAYHKILPDIIVV